MKASHYHPIFTPDKGAPIRSRFRADRAPGLHRQIPSRFALLHRAGFHNGIPSDSAKPFKMHDGRAYQWRPDGSLRRL